MSDQEELILINAVAEEWQKRRDEITISAFFKTFGMKEKNYYFLGKEFKIRLELAHTTTESLEINRNINKVEYNKKEMRYHLYNSNGELIYYGYNNN